MGKKLDLSQIENAQLTSSGNDSDLAYLKSMGARALPSNPTANNWSADAIKRQLYKQAEVLFEWSKASNEAMSGFASEVDDYLYKLDTGDIVVDKARKDAEGNTITETYETKEDAIAKINALPEDLQPYFVYKGSRIVSENPGKGQIQTVNSGLYTIYTSADGSKTIQYGTVNSTAEGTGFKLIVFDSTESSGIGGLVSLCAKDYELKTAQGVKFLEMDDSATYLRSCDGLSELKLQRGLVAFTSTTYSIKSGDYGIWWSGSYCGVNIPLTVQNKVDFAGYLPKSVLAPLSDSELTNKAYVDQTATSAANAEKSRAQTQEQALQDAIDAINASQNFVATYASKADMPTPPVSGLEEKDCVLVLKDESKQDQAYVYKYDSAGWVEVGPLGDYYTKAEIDEKFNLDQHIFVSDDGFVCVDYDKLPVRA